MNNNENEHPDSYRFPLLWKNYCDETVKMYFPDLPGCEFIVCKNFKVTEAIEKASHVLGSHLYRMEVDKQAIPSPTALSKLSKEPGTGIYISVAMSNYREQSPRVSNLNHDSKHITGQLNTLEYTSHQDVERSNNDTTAPVQMMNFKREAQCHRTSHSKNKLFRLWEVLVVGVLVVLVAGIINLSGRTNPTDALTGINAGGRGYTYSPQVPLVSGFCNNK